MNASKAGSSTRILAVAIVIALLGIGFGGYFALKPASVTTQTVTSPTTMTATAPATTVTATATAPATTVTATATAPATTVTATATATTTVTISPTTTTASTTTSKTTSTTTTPTTTSTTTTSSSVSVLKIAVGGATSVPQGMAFNPTNNEIYVALENSTSVAVISATTNALMTTIPLPTGDQPVALAYDSADNMVYVANINLNCTTPAVPTCEIDVINSATNTLAKPIPVADTMNDIAVNPSTNTIVAASNDDDALFFVNGANNQVTVLQNHTAIPDNSQSVAVDSGKNLIFVGNYYGKRAAAQLGFVGPQATSTCQWKNTNTTYCFTKSLGVDGGQITGVAVNPTTGFVYVANYKANLVNVISESTGKDVANVTVQSPYSLAVDPSSNLVYVASTSSNSMVVISGSTNSVLGSVPVGSGPVKVAVDTNTDAIYVSDEGDGTVWVIEGMSPSF